MQKASRGFGLTAVVVAVILMGISALFSSNASEYQNQDGSYSEMQ